MWKLGATSDNAGVVRERAQALSPEEGLPAVRGQRRTMKVVFLDIDGVLNSPAWVKDLGRDRGLGHLEPDACARVQRLCDQTGAKLVISSTWRLIHKRAAIGDMFRARGLTTTILGMTAALHTKRGHEIQAWLDASPGVAGLGTIDGVVILDDDLEMEHLAPWHVRTDVERGFTDEDLRQAAEVLSRPVPGESIGRSVP